MQNDSKPDVFIRRLAYLVGLAGPFTTVPQVCSIWMRHQATGISFWSSLGVSAIAAFWLTYGVMVREGPIVLSSILWLILDLVIVAGVIRYGCSPF